MAGWVVLEKIVGEGVGAGAGEWGLRRRKRSGLCLCFFVLRVNDKAVTSFQLVSICLHKLTNPCTWSFSASALSTQSSHNAQTDTMRRAREPSYADLEPLEKIEFTPIVIALTLVLHTCQSHFHKHM